MTRDEIKLVTFILFAILAGVATKHWRNSHAAVLTIQAPSPAPHASAKPPYVFKTPKDARDAYSRTAKTTGD